MAPPLQRRRKRRPERKDRMMTRVRVTRQASLWVVEYACCDTRTMRFHEWRLAMRIAVGHQCPKPYPTPGRRAA